MTSNGFLLNQTDGTYYYINNLGNLDKIDNAPITLFSKYSSFASGRGFLRIAGCGIFYGTLGYMLIGFFNDSTITVAPLFWCLLGMGMAVNKKIKTTGTVSSFE